MGKQWNACEQTWCPPGALVMLDQLHVPPRQRVVAPYRSRRCQESTQASCERLWFTAGALWLRGVGGVTHTSSPALRLRLSQKRCTAFKLPSLIYAFVQSPRRRCQTELVTAEHRHASHKRRAHGWHATVLRLDARGPGLGDACRLTAALSRCPSVTQSPSDFVCSYLWLLRFYSYCKVYVKHELIIKCTLLHTGCNYVVKNKD